VSWPARYDTADPDGFDRAAPYRARWRVEHTCDGITALTDGPLSVTWFSRPGYRPPTPGVQELTGALFADLHGRGPAVPSSWDTSNGSGSRAHSTSDDAASVACSGVLLPAPSSYAKSGAARAGRL
jgi:hypothetical protein